MRLPSGITVPDETRARLRDALSPINLHIAGVALLALLCAFLAVRVYLVHGQTGTQGEEAVVMGQARVAAADIAARPLRGVDAKLQASQTEADAFYQQRLPFAYSDVAAALGALAHSTNVRLSRASYVQAAPGDGATELRIDAAVTGDYLSLAHFINGLERSHTFFLIENLALSGAQNGLVNVQLRIGTWIREPMPNYAAAQTVNGARP